MASEHLPATSDRDIRKLLPLPHLHHLAAKLTHPIVLTLGFERSNFGNRPLLPRDDDLQVQLHLVIFGQKLSWAFEIRARRSHGRHAIGAAVDFLGFGNACGGERLDVAAGAAAVLPHGTAQGHFAMELILSAEDNYEVSFELLGAGGLEALGKMMKKKMALKYPKGKRRDKLPSMSGFRKKLLGSSLD